MKSAAILCTLFLLCACTISGEPTLNKTSDDIPSIDTLSKDKISKDWPMEVVQHFLPDNKNWEKVQNANGVEGLLGKPSEKKIMDAPKYRSRGEMVREIWFYDMGDDRFIIGFSEKGRTLYIAYHGVKIP